MKILMVGGSGMVGTFIYPYISKHHEIKILDIKEPKIKLEDVTSNLNILDSDYLFKISSHINVGDVTKSIMLHNEIVRNACECVMYRSSSVRTRGSNV